VSRSSLDLTLAESDGFERGIRSHITDSAVYANFSADNRYSVSASVIYDLLLVKSKRADVSVLSSTDVDFIIDTLCVS